MAPGTFPAQRLSSESFIWIADGVKGLAKGSSEQRVPADVTSEETPNSCETLHKQGCQHCHGRSGAAPLRGSSSGCCVPRAVVPLRALVVENERAPDPLGTHVGGRPLRALPMFRLAIRDNKKPASVRDPSH